MELSMRQTPRGSKRSSIISVFTKASSLSRSPVESYVAKASYSDSVHTGIIRIPRVPPNSEAATSVTTMTQSVNTNNTNTTIAVIEHNSYVPPPVSVSTMHHNDGANLVPSSPGIQPTTSPFSECIGDFATNEQQLQLYLKQNGLPYRVMRRNVETDLEAGLQAYFELDVLDEKNKFMCDRCTVERMEKRGFINF